MHSLVISHVIIANMFTMIVFLFFFFLLLFCIYIGKSTLDTHNEAETPTLWSPDAKSHLVGNDPDVGKD